MLWTLVYNIILTKSASLFQAQHQWSAKECQRKSIMPGSYVFLEMVALIRVPLNMGQYMYDTQDQVAGPLLVKTYSYLN